MKTLKLLLGGAIIASLAAVGLIAVPAHAASTNTSTLFFIKTKNTGSGQVEIHTATVASGYKGSDLHAATRFSYADAQRGYFQVIERDLYFIKTCSTGSGKIEVFSATAASGYKSGLAAAYPFSAEACPSATQPDIANSTRPYTISGFDNGFPQLYRTVYGDYARTQALSRSGRYYNVTLPFTSNDVYADNNGWQTGYGKVAVRYGVGSFIKTRGQQSGKIEYFQTSTTRFDGWGTNHVANLTLATPTVFNPGDASNGIVSTVDVNSDGRQEVSLVKLRNTGSGKIEVFHTAPGNYRTIGLASSTWFTLPDASNGVWQYGSDY